MTPRRLEGQGSGCSGSLARCCPAGGELCEAKHAEPAPAPAPAPGHPATYAAPCKWAGGWAVRCSFKVQPGDIVTVRNRDGSTWEGKVLAVLNSRDDISTCTTGPADAPLPRHTRGMTYAALRDLLLALAGRPALLKAQEAMRGFDRKQRRDYLDRLIASLTGKPPR